MREFVEFIAKSLVDKPEDVQIDEKVEEQKIVTFYLKVAPEDIGKIIGKHGKNAQAIRTLLTAISSKEGKKAIIEIIDK
jgi:hypothetical protein